MDNLQMYLMGKNDATGADTFYLMGMRNMFRGSNGLWSNAAANTRHNLFGTTNQFDHSMKLPQQNLVDRISDFPPSLVELGSTKKKKFSNNINTAAVNNDIKRTPRIRHTH